LRNWRKLAADNLKGARELTEWQHHVREHWGEVSISQVVVRQATVRVGAVLTVEAEVVLGSLSPSDVRVEAYTGTLGSDSEICNGRGFEMKRVADTGPGTHRYAGDLPCPASGRFGLTLRVLPHHENLPNPLNFKHIYWVREDTADVTTKGSSDAGDQRVKQEIKVAV